MVVDEHERIFLGLGCHREDVGDVVAVMMSRALMASWRGVVSLHDRSRSSGGLDEEATRMSMLCNL